MHIQSACYCMIYGIIPHQLCIFGQPSTRRKNTKAKANHMKTPSISAREPRRPPSDPRYKPKRTLEATRTLVRFGFVWCSARFAFAGSACATSCRSFDKDITRSRHRSCTPDVFPVGTHRWVASGGTKKGLKGVKVTCL